MLSTDNGSTWSYNYKTTTFFKAYHKWTNDETNLELFWPGWDLAQSTGTQGLTVGTGNAADENVVWGTVFIQSNFYNLRKTLV